MISLFVIIIHIYDYLEVDHIKLRNHSNYVRFWLASTSSYFGAFLFSLALQVLVVVHLHGTAVDVGWLNASRWLPYVVLGLAAGVIIDRLHRKVVLVVTDISRSILLTLIFLTAIFDVLSIGWLMVIMILFGVMSIFNDAAYQSLVPEIVPRKLLTRANARLEQSAAVAETGGPVLSGALVSLITAPFTILINAFTYLISGVLMSTINHKPVENKTSKPFKGQVSEGLRWVYNHQYLKTLALNTHVWFFFHSMTITVIVTFVLIELQYSSFVLGFIIAALGLGALIGTSLSSKVGEKWGVGRTMTLARALYFPAIILIALTPATQQDELQFSALAVIITGQLLYGFAMGLEGPVEMGYRQSITPMHLQGRMNATMRSINRSMVVIGAPISGAIADFIGFREALWIAGIGLAIVAIWFAFSPMWNAMLEDEE